MNRKSAQDIAYEIYEAPLAPAEFEARLREYLANADECRTADELIAWFTKRYSTVEARLRYAKKHAAIRAVSREP